MDPQGNVYELTKEEIAAMSMSKEEVAEHLRHNSLLPGVGIYAREDAARLDGYLHGRAESDRKNHGRLIFDSSGGKTYRKDRNMGIENIEELTPDPTSVDQGDPGDETDTAPEPKSVEDQK